MQDNDPVSVVESVNLAVVRTLPGIGPTGFDKQPIDHPVTLTVDGVEGDTVLSPRHGGRDKAAYVYSVEDAAWWSAQLDRPAPPGVFGENLTTRGLAVSDAVVGERWRIGGALVEVAQPRTPCATLRTFWDVPDLMERFTAAARPGAYLRIVQSGAVRRGDEITLVERPAHGVTLAEAFRAIHGEADLIPHVLRARQLPARTRAILKRRSAGVRAV